MPFTLAHPAYVLPLRRLGLPVSALAVGSMVPDVPLFTADVLGGSPITYAHTHSPLGVLTTDLALGLLLWLLWCAVRPALHDGLPARVRERAAALHGSPPAVTTGLRAAAAIVIGAAVHALLDELTHPGRWAATHVDWFAEEHAGLLGTKWAQYVGGALGLTVIAVVLLLAWRRTPAVSRPRRCPSVAPWVLLAPAVTALLAGTAGVVALLLGTPAAQVARRTATQGVVATAVVLLVAAGVWHLVLRSDGDAG